MKQFFKKALIALAIIIAGTTIYATPTYAYSCRDFLGMKSWDCNIQDDWKDEATLKNNIVIIAANVLTDIGVIAAYLVIGYVIYGGYLYMFSSGDPGKAASGKKTLTHAFIGLAIVMLSNVILSAIRIALLNNAGSFAMDCTSGNDPNCINNGEDAVQVVTNTINWFIAIAGVVSVIFVVVGGIGYVTSSGDPGKLKKAKDTITYALIGLAIVALAEVIVIFVSNTIRDAEARIEPTTSIAKEYHEN